MDTPNRVSDAGPDQPERVNDWRDEIADAIDALKDAKNLYRDDTAVELRLRQQRLRDAQESIAKALNLLPGNHGFDMNSVDPR